MTSLRIAYKTLDAFERLIQADQGSAYRGWLGRVIPHIGDAYRQGEERHRSHMGASLIGGECARAIWLSWRWMTKSNHGGRILRLFNRGHLEEARFIAMLLTIGCQVYQQDANGNQYRISHAEGHFGGSGDGVAIGIPDLAPQEAALSEFKTHGEKSFIELAGKLDDWRKHLADPKRYPFTGKGLREAKFEHFVQMQTYMRKMGLMFGIYIAVNKNTDDVYAEIVFLEPETADQYLDRSEKLVWMNEPPDRIHESAGFWKCRFCDHKPVCHLGAPPDRNCRSCEFSKPIAGAKWFCTHHNAELSKETQLEGCGDYVIKKSL